MKIVAKHTLPEATLEKFSIFLADGMGLFFPKERWGDLEKKLNAVMHSFGFEDLLSCIHWLMHNPLNREQITILAYHLTIGETYFFRDSRMFSILQEKILPEIIYRNNKTKQLHIWSAGCCTGEEPYSLAIMLHKILPNLHEWKIKILGTDINREFLKKAEKAHYKKWAFRATPPEIISRYFTKNEDSTLSPLPTIKDTVTFSYLNLVDDTYSDEKHDIHDIDLILCNNVLIYFSQKQVKKTIQALSASLVDKGWLSVTAIEAPFVDEPKLTAHNFSNAIFFKKESKELPKQPSIKPPPQKKMAPAPIEKPKEEESLLKVVLPAFLNLDKQVLEFHFSPQKNEKLPISSINTLNKALKEKTTEVSLTSSYEQCQSLYNQKQYQQVINKLSPTLEQCKKNHDLLPKYLPELTLLIRTYANQGNTTKALELCQWALTYDKLDTILHYLHAVLLQSGGDSQGAKKSLKNALFLDPNFVAAYYLLGTIELQNGHPKEANKNFDIALEMLKAYSPEDILPGTEDLTPEYLKNLISAGNMSK